jgi:hypothetical protein
MIENRAALTKCKNQSREITIEFLIGIIAG